MSQEERLGMEYNSGEYGFRFHRHTHKTIDFSRPTAARRGYRNSENITCVFIYFLIGNYIAIIKSFNIIIIIYIFLLNVLSIMLFPPLRFQVSFNCH